MLMFGFLVPIRPLPLAPFLRATAATILLSLLPHLSPLRGEVVYENLKTARGRYAAVDAQGQPTEFGDEVALAGVGRIVTEFLLEYYGVFTAQGDETVRLRFYINDAPGTYLKPGTLLYDSGPLAIEPGYRELAIDIPDIEVPNSFTWTVSFGGLTQQTGDRAELLIYSPPTTGAPLTNGKIGSYNDFWKRDATGWTLTTAGAYNDFGARITAREDQIEVQVSRHPSLPNHLLIAWPAQTNATYQLQSTVDFLQWSEVTSVYSAENTTITFPQAVDPSPGQMFYRAVRLRLPPKAVELTVQDVLGTGARRLSWVGDPNGLYQVKWTSNFLRWETLATVRAGADGTAEYLDRPSTQTSQRFYRVWTPW